MFHSIAVKPVFRISYIGGREKKTRKNRIIKVCFDMKQMIVKEHIAMRIQLFFKLQTLSCVMRKMVSFVDLTYKHLFV